MFRGFVVAGLLSVLVLASCATASAPLGSADLAEAIASQPVVLLGEIHDNSTQHGLRVRALSQLLAGGARPALLMEQFDREHQVDLDRVLARPAVTPDEVIAAGAPGEPAMQGWSWPLYRPYLALAIQYRLPVVAANVSRADVRRVLEDGLPALGFDPKVPNDIEAAQAKEILASHCGMLDEATANRMVAAQVARDQFMGRMIEIYAPRGAVLLAGDGHVRADIGVPRWLSPATRARSIAIGLIEDGGTNDARYDLGFMTAAEPRVDPCTALILKKSVRPNRSEP